MEVMEKLGMSEKIVNMAPSDCLFFYQMIIPTCDTYRHIIGGDPRMSYFRNM